MSAFPPGALKLEVIPVPPVASPSDDAAKTPEQLRATGPASDAVARATRETTQYQEEQQRLREHVQAQEVALRLRVAQWRQAVAAARKARGDKLVPLVSACAMGFAAGLSLAAVYYLWDRSRAA
ncbi:MAG: hypothetical protein FJ361_10350 [Gemmatimonadetes bacterium]|nr:hypothetical protein [Gemmatimonadota bacterium]